MIIRDLPNHETWRLCNISEHIGCYCCCCYHWKGSPVAVMGLLRHVLRVEGALVQLHLLLLLPFGESLKVTFS